MKYDRVAVPVAIGVVASAFVLAACGSTVRSDAAVDRPSTSSSAAVSTPSLSTSTGNRVSTTTATSAILGVSTTTFPSGGPNASSSTSAAALGDSSTCKAKQLSLESSFYGAAGGTYTDTLTFVNVSASSCLLAGWPSIVLHVDSSARHPTHEIQVRQTVPPSAAYQVVRLAPELGASFDIYAADWSPQATAPCPETSTVSAAAQDSITISVPLKVPYCQRNVYVAPIIAGRSDSAMWSSVVTGQ
jgi:hypothetical protein